MVVPLTGQTPTLWKPESKGAAVQSLEVSLWAQGRAEGGGTVVVGGE